LFVSTDTFEIYRDTGTGWDLIGGPGSSTVVGTGAAGQVTYWTGANSVAGNNNHYWDATNNRLGLGTQTPGARLDIHSAADVGLQLNGTGATPSILQEFLSAGVAEYDLGYVWNADVNYQRFRIGDVSGAKEVITIDKQSRYVGINYQYSSLADQPAYTLDVAGSTRATGNSIFAENVNTALIAGTTALSPGNEKLQITGNALISGTIKTGAPTGGTAQTWKLGSTISQAVELDTGNYVEVEINGIPLQLALVVNQSELLMEDGFALLLEDDGYLILD